MSASNEINDKQAELKKEEIAEKIVKKWLILQKIIKEEITLEDVIISQQKNDYDHLQDYFKEYYSTKLNIRKTLEDINKINQNYYKNLQQLSIEENVEKILMQITEPIKNLLFLFRNNYNYIVKLVSLIDDQDDEEKIESLAQLFCNQFYDNILIPNPEQTELLLLIYKLFADEIAPMNSALLDDFLNDSSFLGKFCSSYMNKQEYKLYLSLILNPLILSIENETNDCSEMSLLSIRDYIKNNIKEKKMNINSENENINLNEILFTNIPKSHIIYKKLDELEAEHEEESQRKNNTEVDSQSKNKEDENKTENKEDIQFNEEYKEQLTVEKINNLISHEKNKDMKDFYLYQLEQVNSDTNIFSNQGLLNCLKEKCFSEEYKKQLVEKYKSNFLFIQKKFDYLLQLLFDKIGTIPYTIRCICKIIYLLISKKFPLLPKYVRNGFIGKFIFEKSIFTGLSLENKNVLENKIFSKGTKNCLNEIKTILYNANKCMLFNSNNDNEKTIFNYYLIEIAPTLNKFFDKLIDVKLPKVLDELIKEDKLEVDGNLKDKIFTFPNQPEKNEPNKDEPTDKKEEKNITNDEKEIKKGVEYNYFKENSDEILYLQCICFSMQDILFIMNLIHKNIKIFSGIENYDFFCKTVERIKNEEFRLDKEISKEPNRTIFFVIFKDEKNSQLQKLVVQKNKISPNLVGENEETDLICKQVKFCIKTILKGLNLLNDKDFTPLNMAISTDKFFTALKYILEDLGELNETKTKIPLKWYGQYIYNNKNLLNESLKENDFQKLYDDIYNEESKILNELKSFSSIIITRDGMNLRCAEKILEKIKCDLKHIQESQKFLKIEKFVETEEIEVCIKTINIKAKRNSEGKIISPPSPVIEINDGEKCWHHMESGDNKAQKVPSHAYNIKDFIEKFSDSTKEKSTSKSLCGLIKEDIIRGNRENQIYASFGKYMEIVKNKTKDSPNNKDLFFNISEKERDEICEEIEDYILRKIYDYIYVDTPSENDYNFYRKTLCLDWIDPEQLEIKKAYVNQLGYAELCIKRMFEAKSVFDKLNCIRDAHTNMNNIIKFSSGKNDDAGQDELTPIFQYIVIKARPKRIYSDINYIKTFLGDSSLRGQEGFLVTQMESATSFIMQINHEQLKMSQEEYDKKVKEAEIRHGLVKN